MGPVVRNSEQGRHFVRGLATNYPGCPGIRIHSGCFSKILENIYPIEPGKSYPRECYITYWTNGDYPHEQADKTAPLDPLRISHKYTNHSVLRVPTNQEWYYRRKGGYVGLFEEAKSYLKNPPDQQ